MHAIVSDPIADAMPASRPNHFYDGSAQMSELVKNLTTGTHRVEVALRPTRTVTALKECVDRGWVQVKFTETRGGTELGVPLDPERTQLSEADFAHGTGSITIVGRLSLDWVPLTCVATIDLSTLNGTGHLEIAGEAAAR
jgi:hypothetical protein